eukprot:896376-Pleurochrysis_carterae.AAC.1
MALERRAGLGSLSAVEAQLPQLLFPFGFFLFCESEGEMAPPWPLGRFSPELLLERGEGDLAVRASPEPLRKTLPFAPTDS